jgi:hypothetical protein
MAVDIKTTSLSCCFTEFFSVIHPIGHFKLHTNITSHHPSQTTMSASGDLSAMAKDGTTGKILAPLSHTQKY